jgi:hypothetical protein
VIVMWMMVLSPRVKAGAAGRRLQHFTTRFEVYTEKVFLALHASDPPAAGGAA